MQATTVDRMAGTPLHVGDPRRLGPYELLSRLGTGGQGAVFLGLAPHTDGGARARRKVAIKLLHADQTGDPAARARFVREAMAAKKVARFCAAQVLDADVDGDRPYIVSEYVEGPSLAELVRDRGPIGGGALERLAIGTATALVAIHQAGIVHRDLKPANVLVAPDGPRVIDFGIAKALDGSSTVSSRVVGTPAYMAPEQLQGAPVGPAVDVFAWGVLMTFSATGLPPFGMDSIPLVVNRILHGDPQLGGLSGPVRELVRDCLAKDPARRPTARQILLRLLGQEQAVASPDQVGTEVLRQAATLVATRFAATSPVVRSSQQAGAVVATAKFTSESPFGTAGDVANEYGLPPVVRSSQQAVAPDATAKFTEESPFATPGDVANEYGLPPVALPSEGYAERRRKGGGAGRRVALACAGGVATAAIVLGAVLLSPETSTTHVTNSGSTSSTSQAPSASDGGGNDPAPQNAATRPVGHTRSKSGGAYGGNSGGTYGGNSGSTGGSTTTGGTHGGPTGEPTGKPTDKPTDQPTDKPTDKPTGGTTSPPTGNSHGTPNGSTQPPNCGYAGCT